MTNNDNTIPGFKEKSMSAGENKKVKIRISSDEYLESSARLASKMAHDSNNILGVIEGYASFMLREAAPDSQLAADIGEINKAVDKYTEINRKLLFFGRRTRPATEKRDLKTVISDFAGEFAGKFPGFQIKTVLEETGEVEANREELVRMMTALLENAAEADGVREITVFCGKQDGFAAAGVADDGRGIVSSDIKRLFEPFYTTKANKQGLGLSIVYGVARRNGADIEVETGEGSGSVFRVLFRQS